VAVVNPDNDASIRVLEKIGLKFERMMKLSDEGREIKLFTPGD
jgi:RimJ/RimL family protein N-acetyltransferase